MSKGYKNNTNLPAAGSVHEFDDHKVSELKRCSTNLLHFAENYFYILDLDKGRSPIKLRGYQKRVIRKMRDSRFFIILASRQVGKTSLFTIYALWIALFNRDQRVLIVANKESTAKEIFSRIRLAYEEIPNWLKSGVVEYAKESMELENGSRIGISTTTGTAARGQSISCLIIDEMAYIPSEIMTPFWRSVYPVISSSKKSKIFIASTANTKSDLFYKIYNDASTGKNTSWNSDIVYWHEIEGRDESWKEEQIMNMGGDREAFAREFDCEFYDTGDSLLNEELFENLKLRCIEPQFIFDDGKYLIWEEPDDESVYVIGVDIAEGVYQDYTCVQVLNITDLRNIKQVAIYSCNAISPVNFISKLYEIIQNWGNPLVAIERNNHGAQVVDQLVVQKGYTNLISYGPASVDPRRTSKLGVTAHTNTKYKGVTNMRYWVNDLQCVDIRDSHTVTELKSFERRANGSWGARSGCKDDRVMALIWALISLENQVTEKHFEIVEYDKNEKPLVIKPLDYGIGRMKAPLFKYQNEKYSEQDEGFGAVFSSRTGSITDDLAEFTAQGWAKLDNYNY